MSASSNEQSVEGMASGGLQVVSEEEDNACFCSGTGPLPVPRGQFSRNRDIYLLHLHPMDRCTSSQMLSFINQRPTLGSFLAASYLCLSM